MTLEEIAKLQENLQKTFEPYHEFYERLQNSLGILDFLNKSIDSQLIASLNSITESFQLPKGAVKVVEEFSNIMSANFGYVDYSKHLAKISESVLGACQPIKINEDVIKAIMGITTIPTYDGLIEGLNSLGSNLSCLVNDMYEESEEVSDLEIDFVSNEELQDAIIEQNENPIGFQERVANWTEGKKKKYCIAIFILLFVWNNFAAPYFQQEIGVPVMAWTVAHVKELPEKASKYIADLKEDIEATIIENVPYYYKVSFVDENGELKEGYVSKRSVKKIETTIKVEVTEHQGTEGQAVITE